MANVLINENTMTDIADAIREKLGVSDTYKPSEMPDAIASISGGGGEGGNDPVAVRLATRPSTWPYIPTSLEMANPLSPYYEGGNCIYKLYDASGIKCTPAFNLTGSNMVGKVYKYNDTTLVSEANLALVSGDNRFTFDENDADWDSYNFIVIKLTGGITALNNNIAPFYDNIYIPAYVSTEIIEENSSGSFTITGELYAPTALRYYSSNAPRDVLIIHGNGGGLRSLIAIVELNTTGITNMSYMLYQSYALQAVPLFDTSNVTNMSYMFSYCYALSSVPLFNTSKVTTMEGMFQYAWALQAVPLFDTSNVTNMQYMLGNTNIEAIPLFNTNRVTTFYGMFMDCAALKTIPVINTSSASSFQLMFANCRSLQTAPFFTSSRSVNMQSVFSSCYAMKQIHTPSTLASMASLATSCYALESAEIEMYRGAAAIFSNCYSLKKIIIRTFGNSQFNGNMFNNCYHLTGTVNADFNPNGDKDCFIYVPANMVATLKSASGWSTYADQIRSIDELEE